MAGLAKLVSFCLVGLTIDAQALLFENNRAEN